MKRKITNLEIIFLMQIWMIEFLVNHEIFLMQIWMIELLVNHEVHLRNF